MQDDLKKRNNLFTKFLNQIFKLCRNEICYPFRLVLLQWLHTAVISVAPGAVVIAANQIAGAFRVGIAVALPLPAKALYPVAAAIVVAGHSPGFVRFPLAW